MTAPVFVTGTGTGIGKTHILRAILTDARQRGLAPAALKPVLSGFHASRLAETDTGLILSALGRPATPESVAAITPWRLAEPLSPDMAAARAGARLPLAEIAGFCRCAAEAEPLLFVEGAGGVMSPIAEDGLNLDLIAALGARPVVVAGAYLGAISHTLTALAALRAAGAPAALAIVNPLDGPPVPPEETAETLRRFDGQTPVMVWDGDAEPALAALDLA